jgi:hypothetical protein
MIRLARERQSNIYHAWLPNFTMGLPASRFGKIPRHIVGCNGARKMPKRCKAASAMQSARPSLYYFKARAPPLHFAFLACSRRCVMCVIMCQHAAASDDRSQRVRWRNDLEHLELLVELRKLVYFSTLID